MKIISYLCIVLSMCFVVGCTGQSGIIPLHKDSQFNSTWYTGKAELTSYKLEQARYGELHPGNAVLIFVTEDFSKHKQVKLDQVNKESDDYVSILKLNHRREFNTGIYPYSLMTSIFTPVEINQHPKSIKATTSSQEWCGHTFLQFNKDQDRYKVNGFSYFESEGDRQVKVEADILEDEIWTRIRINPKSLPTGKVKMMPTQMYLRLRHTPIKAFEARTSLTSDADSGESVYHIIYTELKREVHIRFESAFPYQINGWTEKYASGFGPYAKIMETRATLNKRIWSDYWTENSVSDYAKSQDFMKGTQRQGRSK